MADRWRARPASERSTGRAGAQLARDPNPRELLFQANLGELLGARERLRANNVWSAELVGKLNFVTTCIRQPIKCELATQCAPLAGYARTINQRRPELASSVCVCMTPAGLPARNARGLLLIAGRLAVLGGSLWPACCQWHVDRPARSSGQSEESQRNESLTNDFSFHYPLAISLALSVTHRLRSICRRL